ncbi:hypothetical protein ACAG96_02245 [Candidatus Izemoplasma sp. B36]|uniref:hypothetical protein n=1 Tax=Candidatus Izemoplasma sp. B36 TaxID=3242468 RepID=UPI003558ABF4
MIKRDKPKIYSQFEISIIIFYASMVFFLPIILVFTYLFEIDKVLNINIFMFWTLIANSIVTVFGTVYLIFKKDYLKRKVKATYRIEFFYLLFIAVFGLLGFVVIYDYLGGDRAYIANILVLIFALLVFSIIYLGRRYFKFDYIKKK